MIRTFKDKETEKLFYKRYSPKLPYTIQKVALRKLWMIDAAYDINDLRVPPANHLEKLKGNRKGQHSIRVNQQYRICFIWYGNKAYEVEITDYH
jgi:proteic killer suppression protein